MTAPGTTPATGTAPVGVRAHLAVLPAGARPTRPSAVSASLTFAWRALVKMTRVPEQMLDVIMVPVLFTVMFTYLFGGALASSTGEYLHFLLPGTMAMTVVILTMYTGSALNTDIAKGVFDRFRTLPLWRPAPLVGAVLADLVRYALAGTLVLVLGLVMGFRPHGGPLGVLAALGLVCLFATGLGWVFTALGLLMRTPNGVFSIGMVIVFPLSFASNVFVDPDTMPGWLRAFVHVNPISTLVTALRQVLDGSAPAGPLGLVLITSAALTAVFAPLTMHLYRRGGH